MFSPYQGLKELGVTGMTKAETELLEIAKRYGDAVVEFEKRLRDWKQGDQTPTSEINSLRVDLCSSARKYATSTRKTRKFVA